MPVLQLDGELSVGKRIDNDASTSITSSLDKPVTPCESSGFTYADKICLSDCSWQFLRPIPRHSCAAGVEASCVLFFPAAEGRRRDQRVIPCDFKNHKEPFAIRPQSIGRYFPYLSYGHIPSIHCGQDNRPLSVIAWYFRNVPKGSRSLSLPSSRWKEREHPHQGH